ncbi:MAG: HNH endonuclease [Nitrospira sp.]|nr:HNH endonuclease [Nitrospira sp.]
MTAQTDNRSPVAQLVEQPAVKAREPVAERRSYKDRRECLIDAVRKRRKAVRQKALAYKGGRCQKCGYDRCMEALEFHHLTSSRKDFGISSKGYTRSWEKIREELDKCLLLCANCHREVHSELQPPRETVVETSGEFREAVPARAERGS